MASRRPTRFQAAPQRRPRRQRRRRPFEGGTGNDTITGVLSAATLMSPTRGGRHDVSATRLVRGTGQTRLHRIASADVAFVAPATFRFLLTVGGANLERSRSTASSRRHMVDRFRIRRRRLCDGRRRPDELLTATPGDDTITGSKSPTRFSAGRQRHDRRQRRADRYEGGTVHDTITGARAATPILQPRRRQRCDRRVLPDRHTTRWCSPTSLDRGDRQPQRQQHDVLLTVGGAVPGIVAPAADAGERPAPFERSNSPTAWC